MIVQTMSVGAPHFVMKMIEHGVFAGRIARAFGNEVFESVKPSNEMFYLIDNHDRGWADFDEYPGRDPKTGLPFNLVETPRQITIQTLDLGPDFNEAYHPYCGLLATMHMYGVYTGRYGLSDRILIDRIPAEFRPKFEETLNRLLGRQQKLKSALARDPATEAWVEDGPLFQNYKQLQFFDTLALYFNYSLPADRKSAIFPHVPRSVDEDVTVQIKPIDEEHYVFEPFPFCKDGIQVYCEGRYITPVEGDDATLSEALRRAPTKRQCMHFVTA